MFERPQLDEVGKVLVDAADYITKVGWFDGSNIQSYQPACAIIAINIICGRDKQIYDKILRDKCAKRLIKYINLGSIRDISDIPYWNDSSTKEIVVNTMREAAFNQDE